MEAKQISDSLEDIDYSEEVKRKPSLEPVEAVDSQGMADVRRIRLQRFNSAPNSVKNIAGERKTGSEEDMTESD